MNARLVGELARLDTVQQTLEQTALPKLFAGLVAANRKALDAATKAEDERVRLYRTRNAFIGIETLSFIAAHPAAAKDVNALAELWEARKASFDSMPSIEGASLLATALTEAGANRAEKLYRASLPYGRVSGAASGLYYLAEAEASARFAQFVAATPQEAREQAPSEAAIRAAIERLDDEVLALFEKDQTSPAAIPASAALKEARELLERGSLAGATLLAAEAKLAIARRSGDAVAVSVTAEPPVGDSILETFRATNDSAVDHHVLPFLAALRSAR